MKNLFFGLKAILLALVLPFALSQNAQAQINCGMNISYQSNGAFPLINYFSLGLTGDSGCFSPNTTFTWEFGDNSSATGRFPVHTYNQPGIYGVCVTAATNFGSTIVACDTVFVTDSSSVSCEGALNFTFGLITANPNTFRFNNTSLFSIISQCISGNSQFTWTFGDGTSATTTGAQSVTHTYANPGVYTACLKTTTFTGQQLQICQGITVLPQQTNIMLAGMVQADGACLQSNVLVEIIGINNDTYQSQTTNGGADSCYYWFEVPASTSASPKTYVVRATPLTGTDYLSTYFGDAIFWADATILQPTISQYNVNINLVPAASLPPGQGLVTGTITGNGMTVNSVFNSNPISTTFDVTESRVIVLNSAGAPVGFAFVNANGTYSFPDLPVGEYLLRVDNPKVPSQNIPFSITANNPSVAINMSTNASGISTVTSNGKIVRSIELNAYPNPAGDEISLSGVSGNVAIIDSKGRTVIETSTVKNIRIANLPSGLYTIKATNDKQQSVSTRFIKK